MKSHFESLTRFKSKMAGDAFGAGAGASIERKDQRLLLLMALHSADICYPAKPRAIALEWARRAMEELFRQGDREAERGLPISPFMDRSKLPLSSTVVNCQVGFMNVLVKPLLQEWTFFLGDAAERDLMVLLASNSRLWEHEGAKVVESFPAFAPAGTSSLRAVYGDVELQQLV